MYELELEIKRTRIKSLSLFLTETSCIVMMSSFLFLLLAFSNVFGIEYDKIVAIKTGTADDEDSGMNLSKGSYIGVEVYGHYGDLECEIAKLYHQETGGEGDFAPGHQDEFEGRDLHACENEEVIWYPGSVSKVRVIHSGDDGWGVNYITVHFDDSSYLTCGDGEKVFVTNAEFVDLYC